MITFYNYIPPDSLSLAVSPQKEGILRPEHPSSSFPDNIFLVFVLVFIGLYGKSNELWKQQHFLFHHFLTLTKTVKRYGPSLTSVVHQETQSISKPRQKYITPPTISFVWILFGFPHGEPKQFGSIQIKAVPNPDQPPLGIFWTYHFFCTKHKIIENEK